MSILEKSFELSQFDEYREDNRREVKKANGGLPNSLWDTYSAFANCYGGVIILGVKEEKDGRWKNTDLRNASKLRKDFWDTINNSKKVNINLLSEDDVQMYEVGGNKDVIMVIYVPMAKREQKPVYINNDIFNGTFRRNYEGDYHCTRLQVKTMLRDQTERTMDMEVLDKVPMEDLNYDTIHGYRNSHRSLKEGHPFERLSDHEYLRSIGAAAISEEDGKLHPTAAGMLMFGDEYNIVRHFPEYFLDYREELDPTTRWSDRLQSSSGEWSGNVCDFYFRVYNKIIKDIKVPFKMVGGERAGSGVPNIFNDWANEGWEDPVIEERFDPDRTVLSLSFKKSGDKKAAIKSGDKKAAIKSGDKKVTKKTKMQYDKILEFMEEGKEYGIWDFCELLGLKESRTKDILKGLSDRIEIIGNNRDRRYKKK